MKNKWILLALLAAASLLCVLLARARMAYSNSQDFATLIWNLALAWIPFVAAFIADQVSWSRRLLYLIVPLCAVIWLVFFPNAPYILTDFQHLGNISSNAPIWFDVLMLIWFAWTGLFLGVISLYLMQQIVARTFGKPTGWFFAILVSVLSTFGIILGRFYRWNSWDLIEDPLLIARDVWTWFKHPFANLRVFGFALLFSLLFLFVYGIFTLFSSLGQGSSRTRQP